MKNHEQVKQNTIFESMYKINVEDVTFSVIRGGEKECEYLQCNSYLCNREFIRGEKQEVVIKEEYGSIN